MKTLPLLLVYATFSTPSAYGQVECAELESSFNSQLIRGELEAFADQLHTSTESLTPSEMAEFLRQSGVKLSPTVREKGEIYIVIAPFGNHPINVLARIYAEDDISVAFSPDRQKRTETRGSFSRTNRRLLLQPVRRDHRTGFFTITDLHEILHARVFLKSSGSFLGMRLKDSEAYYDRGGGSSYGRFFSLSENLTSRQDYRIALGKAKLALRSTKQETARPKRWLEYFWPFGPQKKPTRIRESVPELIENARVRFINLKSAWKRSRWSLRAFSEELETIENANSRPNFVRITHERQGSERVPLVVIERKFDSRKSNPGDSYFPTIAFTIRDKDGMNTSQSPLEWRQIQTEINLQIKMLKLALDKSEVLIENAERDFQVVSNILKRQNYDSNELVQAVNAAHQSAKNLHEIVFEEYSRVDSSE